MLSSRSQIVFLEGEVQRFQKTTEALKREIKKVDKLQNVTNVGELEYKISLTQNLRNRLKNLKRPAFSSTFPLDSISLQ